MPQATAHAPGIPATPGKVGVPGNTGTHSAAVSLTPAQRAVAEQRHARCAACVRCTHLDPHHARCTAAPQPVSLIHGRCPLRKWPTSADNPGKPAGPERLLLRCSLCPGDIVTLTAAVRDLHGCRDGANPVESRRRAPDPG